MKEKYSLLSSRWLRVNFNIITTYIYFLLTEKGNGHSTDSSRLSVSMETPNNISNNNRGNNKSNAEGGSGKKKKGYWYNVSAVSKFTSFSITKYV